MSFGSRLDAHKERLDENAELLKRVEYCIEHGVECNDWEDKFLEDNKDRLMKGYGMTPAQIETLERIEYKVEFGEEAYWEEYGRGDR